MGALNIYVTSLPPLLLVCAGADITDFNIVYNNLFNVPNGDNGPVWAEAAADGGYWLGYLELSVKQKLELTSTETNCL